MNFFAEKQISQSNTMQNKRLKRLSQKPTNISFPNQASFKIHAKIKTALSNIFKKNSITIIAKNSKLFQRSTSRIRGEEFILSMIIASIDPKATPLSGVQDIMRKIQPEAKMTVSALRQRINSPKASEFCKEVYYHVLEHHLKPLSESLNSISHCNKALLEPFEQILIHDSMSCTLSEQCEEGYKGSGGSASKSLIKVDAIINIKKFQIVETICTDVTEPDMSLSKKIIKHCKAGTLVIQDLGYYHLETFESINALKAFYLSRLHGRTLVFLNPNDSEPIQLGKYLHELSSKGKDLDIDVYISEKKIKTRLVAYLVPDDVYDKRVYNQRKKNKRTPSKEWLARQQFSIFITNVPREIWSWKVVGTVYKIRWQIELIFKVWKSQLNIHYLKGTCKDRIDCLIYCRLIAVAILFTIYQTISNIIIDEDGALSFVKFINWLKRNGRFACCIMNGFTKKLWNELIGDFDLLYKDRQRRRQSTFELIEKEIGYIETFNFQ